MQVMYMKEVRWRRESEASKLLNAQKLTIYKGDRHNDEEKADHLHFVVSDEVQFDWMNASISFIRQFVTFSWTKMLRK